MSDEEKRDTLLAMLRASQAISAVPFGESMAAALPGLTGEEFLGQVTSIVADLRNHPGADDEELRAGIVFVIGVMVGKELAS